MVESIVGILIEPAVEAVSDTSRQEREMTVVYVNTEQASQER